jgi:hypothetical protein
MIVRLRAPETHRRDRPIGGDAGHTERCRRHIQRSGSGAETLSESRPTVFLRATVLVRDGSTALRVA